MELSNQLIEIRDSCGRPVRTLDRIPDVERFFRNRDPGHYDVVFTNRETGAEIESIPAKEFLKRTVV